MMRITTSAKIILSTIFISALTSVGMAHYPSGVFHSSNQQNKASFRYIIFSNSVDDTGRPKDSWRRVKVLLEASSFSENTLRSLFSLLSNRFPTPDWLQVEVYTSLRQIPTPEEDDVGFISEGRDDPEFDKHHRAILIRIQGNEFFRYTTDPPSRTMKTVILNGRDIFNPR